jgi:hypothetical protein
MGLKICKNLPDNFSHMDLGVMLFCFLTLLRDHGEKEPHYGKKYQIDSPFLLEGGLRRPMLRTMASETASQTSGNTSSDFAASYIVWHQSNRNSSGLKKNNQM